MIEERENVHGEEAGEDCHFYFANENLPFVIYGIGTTFPNPKYFIHRSSIDYYIIEYIISGAGYLEIDGKKYRVSAGDIYIIEPGYEHSYYPDINEPFKKEWVTFHSSSFQALFNALGLGKRFVFNNCYEVEKIFEEALVIGKDATCSDVIQLQISLLVCELALYLAQDSNRKTITTISKLALDTKAILDSSIFTKIKINDVADKLNYSTKQISREFEKYFHQTPYKYFLEKKIEVAKRILTSTNLSIKEITNNLCFDNQHSFCNTFKTKVGISPTLYRKQH